MTPAESLARQQATHMICVLLPIQIISEANTREHWRPKAARAKAHRTTAEWTLRKHPRPRTDGPITITITRIAPRELDGDNLQSGGKATRDGVADWLGVDDGDKRLTWVYQQRKGGVKEYGAEISVEWKA